MTLRLLLTQSKACLSPISVPLLPAVCRAMEPSSPCFLQTAALNHCRPLLPARARRQVTHLWLVCICLCMLRETLAFSGFSLLGKIKAKMPGDICLLFECLALQGLWALFRWCRDWTITQILSCKEKSTVKSPCSWSGQVALLARMLVCPKQPDRHQD